MSSSQHAYQSSPLSRTSRRRSRFTYKHLAQLASYNTQCPLRVIAHVDLDAFYAQCEMVRLGVPEDQPLAVQQWQGLIAINYAARAYGLNRHVNVADAQKACPQIIMQHVATWREGDERWAYHEDAFKHIATHKVSLDPYRKESRRILAAIKEFLPATLQRVEKASVDEVFIDLSAQVHMLLLERFPELSGPAPYDDPAENLPTPPSSALDWNADALVDLDEGQVEEDDPDWDDICMNLGAEVIRGVRAYIREQLKYTCSAGVAQNKMLAKLGSGHKKPNNQTIVRNRAIKQFLGGLKLTKIRNLGGKLGDEVVSSFNVETVDEMLAVPIEQLKRKLGDDTGAWLYQTMRGEDHSEVNSRTAIKSMLSAKSFRPTINTFDQAVRWLRIFVADIFSRLVEEGVLENKRRPKTINLHHRQGMQTRSKQAPIPTGKTIDETILFDLAKNLLAQVIVDGRAWPCSNLSLSVGGFEDGVSKNHGIGGFLVRGDEAKALNTFVPLDQQDSEEGRSQKRRRVGEAPISQFLKRRTESESEPVDFDDVPSAQGVSSSRGNDVAADEDSTLVDEPGEDANDGITADQNGTSLHQSNIERYFCDRCQKHLPLEDKEEHADWHVAKDLQDEDSFRLSAVAVKAPAHANESTGSIIKKGHRGRGRPPRLKADTPEIKDDKRQSKLAFGR